MSQEHCICAPPMQSLKRAHMNKHERKNTVQMLWHFIGNKNDWKGSDQTKLNKKWGKIKLPRLADMGKGGLKVCWFVKDAHVMHAASGTVAVDGDTPFQLWNIYLPPYPCLHTIKWMMWLAHLFLTVGHGKKKRMGGLRCLNTLPLM